MFETGLPVRWNVPEADERDGVLEHSGTTSVCPCTGAGSYEQEVQVGT